MQEMTPASSVHEEKSNARHQYKTSDTPLIDMTRCTLYVMTYVIISGVFGVLIESIYIHEQSLCELLHLCFDQHKLISWCEENQWCHI
jgi:hypothetical protein